MSKATDALRKAEKSPAWKNAEVFIIIKLPKEGDLPSGGNQPYGKVKVRHPANPMGKTDVFVWDIIGTDLQAGHATGCGYDKVNYAMSGLTFDGIKLLDNGKSWRTQLEDAGYQVIRGL